MRLSLAISLFVIAAFAAIPVAAEEAEFSASISGFTLDLSKPSSLPGIGTIHYDPDRGFNEEIGLLAHTSIRHKPVFKYEFRAEDPVLIQVKIEDLTTGQKYASESYVATGSAGTKFIRDSFTLDRSPFSEDLWSFLISAELRSGKHVRKIFHVYLIHPDFEPDVTEQNRYRSYEDPEPQTIWEGDFPGGSLEIPPETTGFIMIEQNEAQLEDLLINPILYQLIKARPFRQVEGEVPPGSHYSYTVKIHWKPVIGTIIYRSGFLGTGDNAYRDILREKKVRLYIADPQKSEPNLRVELPME